MTKQLSDLIEQARNHQWSEEEKRQQIVSFVYGNVGLSKPHITREMIEEAYDVLHNDPKFKWSWERTEAENEILDELHRGGPIIRGTVVSSGKEQ